MLVNILGRHIVQAPQDVPVAIEGVQGEEEAQGFDLVLEHEFLRVVAKRKIRLVPPPPCPLPRGEGARDRMSGGERRWKGGREGGFKEVEGGMRCGSIEEPQSLPHELGPGFAMGDAVEASCLDEDPHILEMGMAMGSKEKILETGEGTVPGAFMDQKLEAVLGEFPELHEAHSDFSLLSRVLDLALVDVRGQDLEPHAPSFREVAEGGVVAAAVGDDSGHELGRIMGSEIMK